MKLWTRIKLWFFTIVFAALAGTAGYYYLLAKHGGGTVRRIVDAPAIVQQIQRLSEVVTVKYVIQKVIGLEEQKVPFGSEKVILLVQATVLGGIDLTGVTTQQVVCVNDAVTIRLPPPQVLHAFVDEQETKVWDRSKTWWTPWVPFSKDLESKTRLAALEAVRTAALDSGILSNAQHNAETTIRDVLRSAGVESVQFETMKPAP